MNAAKARVAVRKGACSLGMELMDMERDDSSVSIEGYGIYGEHVR